jgi:alpha-D-ribose 1-methylphosphonate 5-phosphate C-P lyase
MAAMKTPTIELTEQQIQSLEHPGMSPPQIVNPRTKQTFVLLPLDEYERMKNDEYDDSLWTSEERHALAWRAGAHAGWEEMDEYDDLPDMP